MLSKIRDANDRQIDHTVWDNFITKLKNNYEISNMDTIRAIKFDDKVYEIYEIPIPINIRTCVSLDRDLFAWMPFIIFDGPAGAHRCDDPMDQFELNSQRLIGFEHYQDLFAAYDSMQKFVVAWKSGDSASMHFKSAMKSLNRAVDRNPHGNRKFDPKDWHIELQRANSK